MLRVALGCACPDREWSVHGSKAVGELKVSALEFAANPESTEDGSEDDSPQMRRGRMMMSEANQTPSMDLHLEFEKRHLEKTGRDRDACSSLNLGVNTDSKVETERKREE